MQSLSEVYFDFKYSLYAITTTFPNSDHIIGAMASRENIF